MRHSLNEGHIKRVRYLLENNERYKTFMDKAEDIKDEVNRMYSKIIFTNFSEMLDGEYEPDIELKDKLLPLKLQLTTYYDKIRYFLDNLSSEDKHKWSGMDNDVEELKDEVFGKIEELEKVLVSIINNQEITDKFKDIKKFDI